MSRSPSVGELSRAVYDSERNLLGESLKVSKAPDHVARVVQHFFQRLSERFDANCAAYDIKLACSAGCAYCCHARVDVFPHEALTMARYIKANRSNAEQRQIVQRIQEQAQRTAGLTREAHFRARIPCAFLVDSRCSIYESRPTLCRSFHAVDVEPCRTGFEHPEGGQRPVEQVAGLAQISKAAADAGRDVFKKARLDERPYELHQVVLFFLTNPDAEKHWRQGKRVGTPVPEWTLQPGIEPNPAR